MKFLISVPATTANVGPGFDIWGIALDLRNEYTFEILNQSSGTTEEKLMNVEYRVSDLVAATSDEDPLKKLSSDSNNLIASSYSELFKKAGKKPVPANVQVRVNIPLERGLGSSSTAILAGLVMANEVLRHLYQSAYTIHELFRIAADIEGHPDNIAPALYGGWVLCLPDRDTNRIIPVQLPVNAPVKLAGIIPNTSLSTKKARERIPEKVFMRDVIFQLSRAALLPRLLSKDSWDAQDKLAFDLAIQDVLHQDYREPFVPGMSETFEFWREQGAAGSFLSGAGTTLLSFWQKDKNLEDLDLGKAMREKGINSTNIYPSIDKVGLTIEKEGG